MAEVVAGLKAGCERLVHPDVDGKQSRDEHARLIAMLLGMPFIYAIAMAQAMQAQLGTAPMIAGACALVCMFWLTALSLSWTGNLKVIKRVALVVSVATFATLCALAATAASPVLALALIVPLEVMLLTGKGRMAAKAAAFTAFAGSLALVLTPFDAMAASAWHWLAPALYVAMRMARAHKAETIATPAATPFDAIAKNLGAALFVLGEGGEVVHAGERCVDQFGVDRSVLMAGGLFERVHVGDRVPFLCALSRVQRGETTNERLEIKLRVAASEQPAGIAYHRVFDVQLVPGAVDGQAIALIEEARRIEDLRGQLDAALARLEEAEIAKGRFLASVSHELRTPLNAVIGFSDLLLNKDISGELGTKPTEQVGLIREAGLHLLSVVNAILDVSKVESGTYQITREPFALKNAVDLACRMMEPQAQERGVSVTTRIPATVGEVAADQRAVQQILINLISNAVKFTPTGGWVRVTASRSGGVVRLRINDNGIGIEAKDLGKLCQPFMQVQNDYTRQFQGTGLGLSLVKGLVKLHGGEMTIDSAPGIGTAVTVSLPDATANENDWNQPVANDGPKGDHDQTEEARERRQDGVTLRKIA